jgi:N-acetylneuraminic acid mutarotase
MPDKVVPRLLKRLLMKTTNAPRGVALKAIAAVILMGLLTTQWMGAQAWYNPSWLYRSTVTVAGNGSTTLTDLQVKITLNSDSFDFTQAKSDGSDIIITANDGETLIPFWIESWDAGLKQAAIWVKVPTIPSSGTTIFLYYGNSAATSKSSGTLTFSLFDDFESWPAPAPPSVWQNMAPIPTRSADLTASVYDNKIYTFGGYNSDSTVMNTVYEYDPSGGWTSKAPMPTSRWGMVSVELGNKIYVFGGETRTGHGSDANEIYDPVANTWSNRKVVNPLPSIPKYGAAGVAHPDVLYFPLGLDGYEYWMVYTPVTPTSFENPSILRSHDGKTWTDSGITNPVITEGPDGAWNDLENPDPDFIYVSDLEKWFMVWDGGDVATNSRRIALAYSSDGKTWTQYDGSQVNGNVNPIILSGRSTEDIHAAAWERDASGYSKTCVPTLFYQNGTFYLFYSEEANGNNRGSIGLATFTWNNGTNDIENLTRNAGNPIIKTGVGDVLGVDTIFESGGGHIDISKNTGTNIYHMYVVRNLLGSYDRELELLTSSDLLNWSNKGKAMERGAEGQWDDAQIYRSCPVVNSSGEIVLFDNNIRMYYSAVNRADNMGIGIAEITPTGTVDKFSWEGWPRRMPATIADQGLMGVKFGDRIHLFYKSYHYEYDPVEDTYLQRADVPDPRTWGTCAVVDSKIYLIGGNNGFHGTNTNQVLDPVTDTWEQKAPLPVTIYGQVRENPVINGKIYVTHGWDNDYFFISNYMYDPLSDTWAQKGPAIYSRDGVANGVINNKLYVIGGRNEPTSPDGLAYNELYDPTADTWTYGPSQWTTSGIDYVFANSSARYQGNYGLTIRHQNGDAQEFSYAETILGLGPSYVLDFDWNVTSLNGISESSYNPQGFVRLTEEWEPMGNLYFYEYGVPVVDWYTPPFLHLQNSTWDNWHKVTIIRDGSDSRVVFDGNIYSSLITVEGGEGKLRFGAIRTTEYLDNVRVRKWAGLDPATVVGPGLRNGQVLSTWTGAAGTDWGNVSNWFSGILPGSTDYIVIPDVTNNPICTDLSIGSTARLTIKAGGALTVGNLLNDGNITVESSGLTSSGSLIVSGTNIGTGTVTYNRQFRTKVNDGDYHYFSSPVTSNSAANSSKITNVWQWNEVTDSWSSLGVTGLTSIQSGRGYNLAQTTGSDGIISFTGSVLSSNLTVDATSPYSDVIVNGTVAEYADRHFADGSSHSSVARDNDSHYGGGGWNMLGNPYTSAINAMTFVNYGRNLANFEPSYKAVYLYDGDYTGHNRFYYIGLPTGWGTSLSPETHIQAGQGFFVLAMNDTSTFTFTRSMQEHSTGTTFLKSTGGTNGRWPGLQLKARSGKDDNSTIIVFNEDMSLGLDPGYDIGMMGNGPGVVIYTVLVEDNGVNFARQALPIDGSVKNVIPVGIDFEKGGNVIFSADTEPFRNYKFLLEDKTTGIFTDLGINTYTATLPAKTFGTGRFFIHVSTGRGKEQRSNKNDLLGVRIWASQNRQMFIQGDVSERANCEVFDIWGHKVFEIRLASGDYNTFMMPSTFVGVYLVKVTDGLKIFTSKVVFP